MNSKRFSLLAVIAATLVALPVTFGANAIAADAPAMQVRDGWYPALIEFEAMRQNVDIPLKKGVAVIDSRPKARKYDPGHIPGAISIPDSQFEKMADKLPADKSTLLLYYCDGVNCMLSHKSAFKAEKLGYTNIKVYADGMPDWAAKGGAVSVSAAYIKKLIDEKAAYTLIDARPKRVASKGMIPTAINISDSEFDKHVELLPADKSSMLIYYCGGLECVLSDKSADKARKLGYTNVVTYPEGYPEWMKLHEVPSVTTAPEGAATAKSVAATLVAGKEKGSATVESFEKVWKDAPASILLVDVRDPKEFSAGTIDGAVNLPINELEKKIGTLPTNKPVVFICGTGARSGEAYDTVKLLKDEIQAYFLDAEIKFNGDGKYSISQKK